MPGVRGAGGFGGVGVGACRLPSRTCAGGGGRVALGGGRRPPAPAREGRPELYRLSCFQPVQVIWRLMANDRLKLLAVGAFICAVLLPPLVLFGPWTMLIMGPIAVAPVLGYARHAGWLRPGPRRKSPRTPQT